MLFIRVKGPKRKEVLTVSDNQIIELFWQRSEDAITETDAAYGRKLRGLSRRILQNQEDSEEVVNDTYFKTWQSIPTNRPAFFYAYIATICRNLSLNLLNWNRAAKRRAEIVTITNEMELCIPDLGQERAMQGKDIAKALDVFLDTLPKESRVIFLRRYWYAESVEDIAKRYGMTESKVKMQLLRTRNKLKDSLEKEGIYI